ncbi:enolase C-terminal domain-like protein [Microbulbifer taiwanensis]|uniref:enolase C-terminal domain-like protein n=1 Tax=Microbulbifer taiwanensis TaxID=986746 RepID=UPI00366BC71E
MLQQLQPLLCEVAQGLTREQLQGRLFAGAARNALDCALADWEARRSGAKFTGPESLPTVQTLVIDTPDAMADAARVAVGQGVTVLKLKLDDRQVAERVAAVRRAAPDAQLVIDANEAWPADTLRERCVQLSDQGVAMLEQPLPANDDDFLETFSHPLPICADESCHTREDLPRLQGRYEMVNIKLDKTGGITEALALAEAAKAQGFELMLGCMLCTSRAIRAAWPWVRKCDSWTWMGPPGWRGMCSHRCASRPAESIGRRSADRSVPAGSLRWLRPRTPAETPR